jgi:hypothetical protein
MRQYGGSANVDLGGNERVCAFCHTPHHAAEVGVNGFVSGDYLPLWSRNRAANTFNAFQSPTLQITGFNGSGTGTGYDTDIAEGPSRLCMGCHDGEFAVDQHYGATGTGSVLSGDAFNQAGVGASAGGGLTNDHPIGFVYNAVANATCAYPPVVANAVADQDTLDGWICKADANLKYIRPAGMTAVKVVDRLHNGQIMTCATCHDVHNTKNADMTTSATDAFTGNATKNYLVLAPQKDSALCLSCHIK